MTQRELEGATTTLRLGDIQVRHEMAVGTLSRAERATWTGAGGSVCQTRVPCAFTIVFIAAGLLVCPVPDKNVVGLSSSSLVVWYR